MILGKEEKEIREDRKEGGRDRGREKKFSRLLSIPEKVMKKRI